MLIFPEIQLSEGRVVTRTSRAAENIVHDILPFDAVNQFEDSGAQRIHILDVDAATGRDRDNSELIRKIIDQAKVPIQVAGGMRTVNQIDTWLDAGAAHIVLGTLAITDQSLLAQVCAHHPGAILANIATKNGYVMIDGWQVQTAYRPQDIVYDLQMSGVAGIIHFDIDRFESEAAASLALTMEMKQDVLIPIYSSGTVRNLDDMARLRYLPNIHGVIIGRALYEGKFTFDEALEVARQNETRPANEEEDSSVSEVGIQGSLEVYLAAYNHSPAATWWNLDLRQSITDNNPYVDVIIPQEDLDVDAETISRRELQENYERALDSADAVVVVLDGIEDGAWTAFECGFARARGKYVLGIAARGENELRSKFEAMCDDIVTFDATEERNAVLSSLAKEVNLQLLAECVVT